MAPAVRRAPVAPPPIQGLNIGDLATYAGGFTLPEGQYALEFNFVMHAGVKADGTPAGAPRLGVMVDAYPLGGGDPIQQFFSMGTNAHQSMQPHPETGKGVVAVPGGPGANANNKTNWFILLKSLYDCGMPAGYFTDDISVIDGVWVQTQNIPEPAERKGFGIKTGEVQQEERRTNLIPIVTAILDGGKPWEGSGGFDFAPAAPAAKPKAAAPRVAAPVAARPPAAAVRRPAAVQPPPPAEVEEAAGEDEQDLFTVATSAIADIIEKTPQGLPKLTLRTSVFKNLGGANEPNAQAVIDTYFSSDAELGTVLGQLGYKIVGLAIKPAT